MATAQQAADPLDAEIRAYQAAREQLEVEHQGQWVVFAGGKLWKTFSTFPDAAVAAEQEFGTKPVLIQLVGEDQELQLPSSLIQMETYVP